MYCFWRIQIVTLPLVTNCRVGKPSSLRFRYTFPSLCLIFLSLKSYFPRGFLFIDSRVLFETYLTWLGHWYQPTFTVAIYVSQLIGLLFYCYLFHSIAFLYILAQRKISSTVGILCIFICYYSRFLFVSPNEPQIQLNFFYYKLLFTNLE